MAVEANYVSAEHENKKLFVFNEDTIKSNQLWLWGPLF